MKDRVVPPHHTRKWCDANARSRFATPSHDNDPSLGQAVVLLTLIAFAIVVTIWAIIDYLF